MPENWYALTLAILSPVFVLTEDAFHALDKGTIKRHKRNNRETMREIIGLQAEGVSAKEIADIFGYSKSTIHSMVSRWKKGGMVNGSV